MRYRKSRRSRRREGGGFWLCYSDLMSSLLLVFMLVLFYSVYQYHQMTQTKAAELDEIAVMLKAKEMALDVKTSDLDIALTDLEEKGAELEASSFELTEAQKELIRSQVLLEAQNKELEQIRSALALQEGELLTAREDYDAQQAVLNTQQIVMAAQQEKLEKLVGVRADIITQLMRELSMSRITGAQVDYSGAIVFDSEMMFDVGQSVLKEEGKTFLSRFIPNYLRVLTSANNLKYVSQIIIEGHTDTTGGFDVNMKLSQDRAYAVFNYIMSPSFTDISAAIKSQLEKIISVNGRPYNEPVMKNGVIDMAASRRVVIKFRLNDEDTVNSMIEVLRGSAP